MEGKEFQALICKAIHKLLQDPPEFSSQPQNSLFYKFSQTPSISIEEYIARVSKYTKLPLDFLVIPFLYLKRSRLSLTHKSIHRFLITCTCIASKTLTDQYFTNKFYAKVGGISVRELNRLELELLVLLDWNVQITAEEFEDVKRFIIKVSSIPEEEEEE